MERIRSALAFNQSVIQIHHRSRPSNSLSNCCRCFCCFCSILSSNCFDPNDTKWAREREIACWRDERDRFAGVLDICSIRCSRRRRKNRYKERAKMHLSLQELRRWYLLRGIQLLVQFGTFPFLSLYLRSTRVNKIPQSHLCTLELELQAYSISYDSRFTSKQLVSSFSILNLESLESSWIPQRSSLW